MISFSTSVKNARLAAIAGAIDAGDSPASFVVYSGTRPSPGAAVTDQVALATLEVPQPFAADLSGAYLAGIRGTHRAIYPDWPEFYSARSILAAPQQILAI